METVMHKHLTNLTSFHAETSTSGGSWYSAFKRWREAHRLFKEERKRDEIASQLTPRILYDIGESDCQPPGSKSAVWDNQPYRLLMNSIMSRRPSEFDSKQ
jgi:hypothetical protein